MISFPNCKINLGLHITAKRQDGYHDLETIFYPLPLTDTLEIKTTIGQTSLFTTGINVSSDSSNLCIKAHELLKKDYPHISNLEMYLQKNIPIGAGLGGGSADGAFTLKMINEYFDLKISEEKLIDYSLQLGSDCPFFIINTPCLAKGRGEILQTIDVALSGCTILIINTGLHINTAWAFNNISPQLPSISLNSIIHQPIENWKDILTNDFEKPVFNHHPQLSAIKKSLYDRGAAYASMSGSGSTIFGIFKNDFNDNDFDKYAVHKKLLIT